MNLIFAIVLIHYLEAKIMTPEYRELIPAKYVFKKTGSPGNACIKNQASLVYRSDLFPAYSASGQDVWLPYYNFDEPSIVVSAVGARCGKTFLATGKFAVCANTHVLTIDVNKCHPRYIQYITNNEEWWEKGGTAQPFVKIKETLQKKIWLPSISTQIAIADFLDRQCANIDNIIEKTRISIEEYRKLRQAFILQAVTKGVHGDRSLKDSGETWIGCIPVDWKVCRISSLYEERREAGNDTLPILTVSINTGVSDRELSDEENERIFVRSEDKSKYARVYPGDLTYNMMRAWQGAFGAVRVEGMVSPAYVIAKPKTEIDSRYMEALLRTPSAMQEMKRYSYGIADFRMRLYWGYFKNIKVCIPPLSEQKEIADYIDVKSREIDDLINKKEKLIEELDSYKKAMIFEYVTGKKEVM